MSKMYDVKLPITGYAIVTVEADSEDHAIQKALENGATLAEVEEWETHSAVVRGNVFYGLCNTPQVLSEHDA